MHVHAFRPTARWALTVTALTALTALACGGALPAQAAQTSRSPRSRPAQMATPVSGHGLRVIRMATHRRSARSYLPSYQIVGPYDWGTIPCVSASAYGYEYASSSQGDLWLGGSLYGPGNTRLGLAFGTSPSVAALTNGQYVVAFQARNGENSGDLWLVGSAPTPGDTGLGMAGGTNPAVAALTNGGYEAAFQANGGDLWVAGDAGTFDTHLGVAPGTSPAITGLPGGGYEVAFQARGSGLLWVTGTDDTANTYLGMAPYTSPAITGIAGGFEAAFQANTGVMWTYEFQPNGVTAGPTSYGVTPYTSPAMTTGTSGGYEIAFFQNPGDQLWDTGSSQTQFLGVADVDVPAPSISEADGAFYYTP